MAAAASAAEAKAADAAARRLRALKDCANESLKAAVELKQKRGAEAPRLAVLTGQSRPAGSAGLLDRREHPLRARGVICQNRNDLVDVVQARACIVDNIDWRRSHSRRNRGVYKSIQ